jgi:hypothetical protein
MNASSRPKRFAFLRQWWHGSFTVLSLGVCALILHHLQGLSVWVYDTALGESATGTARVVSQVITAGCFILVAPWLVSICVRDAVAPDVRDELCSLSEEHRALEEWLEQTVDRSAANTGLDWRSSAFSRVRGLLQQGRDAQALTLFRQETGIGEDEAQRIIEDWEGKVPQAKLCLLLRHLERTVGTSGQAAKQPPVTA